MRDSWEVPKQLPIIAGNVVRHSRCSSQYCPQCGMRLTIRLQRLIERAVERWFHPRMITLTVNRAGFLHGPQAAYSSIMKRKLLALLKRELNRKFKALNHNHHVWVMEFHLPDDQNCYWPHFHMLVDSSLGKLTEAELWEYVDHWGLSRSAIEADLRRNSERQYEKTLDDLVLQYLVQKIWNGFAETYAVKDQWERSPDYLTKTDVNGRLISSYYQMGRCDVTAFRHDKAGKPFDAKTAARAAGFYMAKYLGWFPEDDSETFPDWVTEASHVPRSHTSQGFKAAFGQDAEDLEDKLNAMTEDDLDDLLAFDPDEFQPEDEWEEFPEYIGLEDDNGDLQPAATGWVIRHNLRTGEQFRYDPNAEEPEVSETRERRKIRERLKLCRQSTVLLREEVYQKPTGETFIKYKFIQTIPVPFDQIEESIKDKWMSDEETRAFLAGINRKIFGDIEAFGEVIYSPTRNRDLFGTDTDGSKYYKI